MPSVGRFHAAGSNIITERTDQYKRSSPGGKFREEMHDFTWWAEINDKERAT